MKKPVFGVFSLFLLLTVARGQYKDLPGAKGLVSLRTAFIAANNPLGADTITFAPSLSGGTITVKLVMAMPMVTLIHCQRSVEGRPASKATSIAMTPPILPWRVQRSLPLLLSLASVSFPATTSSRACGYNISPWGS